jgi:CubicO group peptidase (beta-lactamase class C family)
MQMKSVSRQLSVCRFFVACLAVGAFVTGVVPTAAASSTPADYSAIDSYVRAQMSDAHLPGLALGIVHDGQVAHVQGFGQADSSGRSVNSDTPFIIGSVSKSFTALAVMQLVESGRVDLDASAQTYVPEFRLNDGGASKRITVRMLLNQTSGIPTAAGIDPLTDRGSSLDAQIARLSAVTPQWGPGAGFAYSNANYEVLGRLVELVSGQSFGDYLQAHVLDPLGMSHTYTSVDAARAAGLPGGCEIWFGLPRCLAPGTGFRPDFLPAGFVISSAGDMSRYVLAQLDGGSYAGGNVLSPAGIAEMHSPVAAAGLSAQGGGYGMGWFAGPRAHIAHTVWHNGSAGGFHSMVLMLPDSGWGIVVLTNAESLLYEMLGRIDVIADGVAAQLINTNQPGTIAGLYVAFDVLVVLLIALQLRTIVRLLRRPAGIPHRKGRIRTALWEIVIPAWRELLVPTSILLGLPAVLGAPWINLGQTDVGACAFALALILLATGALRLYKNRVLVAAFRYAGLAADAPMRFTRDRA